MAQLTDDDILHYAALARISLSAEDVSALKTQLSDVLAYVEQLESIDTGELKPTSQVTGLTNVFRDDNSESDTMATTDLLDQVPDVQDNQIKVPRII